MSKNASYYEKLKAKLKDEFEEIKLQRLVARKRRDWKKAVLNATDTKERIEEEMEELLESESLTPDRYMELNERYLVASKKLDILMEVENELFQ